MDKKLIALTAVLLIAGCTKSCSRQQEHKTAVFFKGPEDGAVVTSPVEVSFGVTGKKVRPALEDINEKSSGHYHLLIDNPQGFIEKGQAIPNDEKNIHLDKGELSTSLIIPPGIHTLTLQFADGAHLSYGKEMASTIQVTIVEFSEEDMGPD